MINGGVVDIDIASVLTKAKAYLNANEYPEAVTLCKEALKQLEDCKIGQDTENRKLQVLFCLSDICNVSGNWMDGLMYLSTVITKASEIGNHDIRNEAIIRSADILSKMGKWGKALEKYDEAEKSVKEFKNMSLLGRTHLGKGVVFWRQGRYDEATKYAESALRMGQDINNLDLIGTASALKASINFDLRNYRDAIEQNDHALNAYKTLNNTIEIARILNNKGEVYKITGELTKAIDTFKEGLSVLSNSVNHRSLAYLYTNLAECQIRQGKLLDSQITSKLARNAVSLSEDRYIKAQLSMVFGLIENRAGNHTTALKYISEAESHMKKLDIPYDLGVIQLEHARILKDTDRTMASAEYRNAISSFKKADTQNMLIMAETELNGLGF